MRFLIAVLGMLCLSLTAQAEEMRIALLIGNNDYPASVGRLANTHNDVSKLKASLQATGFEVITGLDQNKLSMLTAIDNFNSRVNSEAARGKEVVAFFYYSGHGVSLNRDGQRRNYLLPAKENITSSLTLTDRGIDLSNVIGTFAASKAKAFFVISDACRNELEVSFTRSMGGSGKGFDIVPSRPGMLIAFSTAAGATAPDDGKFAEILAARIRTPGKRAAYTFVDAMSEISSYRGMNDQPFLSTGRLPENLCFAGCQLGEDDRDWQRVSLEDSISAYQLYLTWHPNGKYTQEARIRIQSKGPNIKPAPKTYDWNSISLKDWNTLGMDDPIKDAIVKTYLKAIQIAADQSDKRAIYLMGYAYDKGTLGVEKNLSKALRYFEVGCSQDEFMSCNDLGFMYSAAKGVTRSDAKAAPLYRKACDGGYILACANLGGLYRFGLGVQENTATAIKLFEHACKNNIAAGCYKLGSTFIYGPEEYRDFENGRLYLEAACKKEEMLACERLGSIFYYGANVTEDKRKAFDYYKKSCDGGHLRACVDVARYYRFGPYIEKNTNKAKEILKASCDKGYNLACDQLGEIE